MWAMEVCGVMRMEDKGGGSRTDLESVQTVIQI